ncbi:dipeptidylpeptidase, partial [Rhizophlyctis rosea]
MSPSATWDAIRTEVRAFHAQQAARLLPTCKDFVFDDHSNRIYFLGNDGRSHSPAAAALRAVPVSQHPTSVHSVSVGSASASAGGTVNATGGGAGGNVVGNGTSGSNPMHSFGKCLTLFVADISDIPSSPSKVQTSSSTSSSSSSLASSSTSTSPVSDSESSSISMSTPPPPQLLQPELGRTGKGTKRTRSWDNGSGRASGNGNEEGGGRNGSPRSDSRRRTNGVLGATGSDEIGESGGDPAGVSSEVGIDDDMKDTPPIRPDDYMPTLEAPTTPPETDQTIHLPTTGPACSDRTQQILTQPYLEPQSDYQTDGTMERTTSWKPLITVDWLRNNTPSCDPPSKEEQLLKERKRISTQGILGFQVLSVGGGEGGRGSRTWILFSFGNSLYVGEVLENKAFTPTEIPTPPTTLPRLDAKLIPSPHPSAPPLTIFFRDRDLYCTTLTGIEQQLTFSESPHVYCGCAEYIMQEEFHRFTGFWVEPMSARGGGGRTKGRGANWGKDGTGGEGEGEGRVRVCYLEVDEEGVEVVCIPRQGIDAGVDKYRYPRAGKPNASAEIKIVEFVPKLSAEHHPPPPHHRRLWPPHSLTTLFPWHEYIPRLGWIPNQNAIWAQLLDRKQQRTVVVRIPGELFMTYEEFCAGGGVGKGRVDVLYEERSRVWSNVTDCVWFLGGAGERDEGEQGEGKTKFLWASERSGFRHLYLVESGTSFREACRGCGGRRDSRVGGVERCECSAPVVYPPTTIRQITGGEWQVMDHHLFVDDEKEMVYFMGKRESVLEAHFYVASFAVRDTIPISAEAFMKGDKDAVLRDGGDVEREGALDVGN